MEPATSKPSRLSVHVDVFNRQQTRRINLAFFRQVIRRLLDDLPPVRGSDAEGKAKPPGGQLAVHLITASDMARLNQEFLGHAGSTDVITFDYQESQAEAALCGEIFISVDDAVAGALRFRASWQMELVRYLAHGALHLRGYDDGEPEARREMKRWENRLLKDLSESFDWSKLASRKHAARRK